MEKKAIERFSLPKRQPQSATLPSASASPCWLVWPTGARAGLAGAGRSVPASGPWPGLLAFPVAGRRAPFGVPGLQLASLGWCSRRRLLLAFLPVVFFRFFCFGGLTLAFLFVIFYNKSWSFLPWSFSALGVPYVCSVSCSLVRSFRSLCSAVRSFPLRALGWFRFGVVGAHFGALAVRGGCRGAVPLPGWCCRVCSLLGAAVAGGLPWLCGALCRRLLVCLRAGCAGAGRALVAAVVLPPALAGVAGGVVAVAGSRSLPPGGASLVAGVARALVAAGASLVAGCAVGADAAAVAAVPLTAVRVLAAFGPGGVGSWAGSAVAVVSRFAAAGGAVVWWAGGSASVPLRARLGARTAAVVSAASAGLVGFFGSPASRGSTLAVRCAAARGLPVLAFPLGFPAVQLPALGAGCWAPAGGSGIWVGVWVWSPSSAQIFLF
jgi:hypothetical protein